MTLLAEARVRTLNFVLTGNIRAGANVLRMSVNAAPGVTCHGDLFAVEEGARREAHEEYFGVPAHPGKVPHWFHPLAMSPGQYLSHAVFDTPLCGEKAIGCLVRYGAVRKWEMYDLFEEKEREGDFCVVHVTRNPVASFISLKQAHRNGVWSLGLDREPTDPPSPVRIVPDELTAFCREDLAARRKIADACQDALTVAYADLLDDFQGTMLKVFDFLEVSVGPSRFHAGTRRLRNRPMEERATNFDEVRRSVPCDVRSLLDAPDFV